MTLPEPTRLHIETGHDEVLQALVDRLEAQGKEQARLLQTNARLLESVSGALAALTVKLNQMEESEIYVEPKIQMSAPDVTVQAAEVNVPAPQVTVMPHQREVLRIVRDGDGRIEQVIKEVG